MSYISYAQTPNPYAGNTVQGGNILFDCSHKTGPYANLYNKNLGISEADLSPKTNNCLRALLSQEGISNVRAALKQVFSATRAAELSQEKVIRLHMSITPQGNLAYITFTIHTSTLVTPAEIGALENALRAKNFPLENGSLCTQLTFMGYQYVVNFSKLY